MESVKLVLLSVVLAACVAPLLAQNVAMRWCVVSEKEMRKCSDFKSAVTDLNPSFTCVQRSNRYECMRAILEGQADVIRLDDTDIYAAGKVFGLRPLVKETFSTDPNAEAYLYKAVIVVKANGPITSPDGLSQRKSCHTGVGRTVGWTVPVSNLVAKGIMPVQQCDNPVKNVASFFSQSCAPGAFDPFNNPQNDNPASVCALCGNSTCPSGDTYAGYEGAMRCLMDGQGDVAFVKHSTIGSMTAKGVAITKSDFRLLCPDGKSAADLKLVDDWANCHWATRPTDVIATNPAKSEDELTKMRNFLDSASVQFDAASSEFQLFSSAAYSGKDLMVSDGAVRLLTVDTAHADYTAYINTGYMNTLEHYITCGAEQRWCVISDAEDQKCRELSAALAAKRISFRLDCVLADNHKQCMEKIANSQADLVTVDGGDVYLGGKYHSLVPIAAEKYSDDEGTSYYAVAVVRKSNTAININSLKGKTSCHTGIGKTSGWNIPAGTLMRKGLVQVEPSSCNLAQALGSFFSSSCAPGALSPQYNPGGNNPQSLCTLCGGEQFCKRSTSNKYYGYMGAFRCLVEKNADVAFVKHSTVPEYTDGKLQEGWARSLRSQDFELLCLDGSRRPVTDYKSCSLSKVSSHAVLTSSTKSVTVRAQYQTILSRAQMVFGRSSDVYNMFERVGGKEGIFSSKTHELTMLAPDMQDYKKWLEHSYHAALESIDPHKCVGAAPSLHALPVLALLVPLVQLLLAL